MLGTPRPVKKIDASWYIKPPGLREVVSSGGVVARLKSNRILVAMVREQRNSAPVLPKGSVEPGETLEQAASREIEEEAGLTDLTLLANLGALERLDFDRSNWKTIHYFLFVTGQAQGKPTDKHKTYEVEWHDLHALPAMFWPEQRALVEANKALIERLIRNQP